MPATKNNYFWLWICCTFLKSVLVTTFVVEVVKYKTKICSSIYSSRPGYTLDPVYDLIKNAMHSWTLAVVFCCVSVIQCLVWIAVCKLFICDVPLHTMNACSRFCQYNMYDKLVYNSSFLCVIYPFVGQEYHTKANECVYDILQTAQATRTSAAPQPR